MPFMKKGKRFKVTSGLRKNAGAGKHGVLGARISCRLHKACSRTMIATSPRISITGNPSKNSTVEEPRVAPTSRLAGPLRSQDRPRIGRGDRDVARVRGAHTCKTMYAPSAREGDCHGRLV